MSTATEWNAVDIGSMTISELEHSMQEHRKQFGESVRVQFDAHWNGEDYDLEHIIFERMEDD